MGSAEGYSGSFSCCCIDLMMSALMFTLYIVNLIAKQILIASFLVLFLCISGTPGVTHTLLWGFTASTELATAHRERNDAKPSRSHLTQQRWSQRWVLQTHHFWGAEGTHTDGVCTTHREGNTLPCKEVDQDITGGNKPGNSQCQLHSGL